jgi:uncharacterized membrane protein YraQ (UPF0718 family)
MDITLLVLISMVGVAIFATLWKGGWQLLILGFKRAGQLVSTIWVRLLLGLTLGGLTKVLIPSSLIVEWLGPASGLKGILIGSYAGIFITGGPYVTIPIITSIFTAGAGAGPVIAFLVSWNSVSLPHLFTWSIPFLGTKLALTRYIVAFFIPPLVGLAGGAIYQLMSAA